MAFSKLLRSRALRRVTLERCCGTAVDLGRSVANHSLLTRPLQSGITVVTVSHNSLDELKVQVAAVQRLTCSSYRHLVVDNRSTDGTRQWLTQQEGVDAIFLPINMQHGPALDLGVACSRTAIVIVLDVDAFPITEGWESTFVSRIEEGSVVAGGRHDGPLFTFAHPSALAVNRTHFLAHKDSFRPVRRRGLNLLDTGAALSMSNRSSVSLIDVTERRGPGFVGTVYGGTVYHNWASVRSRIYTSELSSVSISSQEAWREALARYLPWYGEENLDEQNGRHNGR